MKRTIRTGPEHYREAERLGEQADTWMDADLGWKACLSTEERIARRMADLAAAQVHATLALTAATALAAPVDGRRHSGMNLYVLQEWESVAGIDEHPRGGGADE